MNNVSLAFDRKFAIWIIKYRIPLIIVVLLTSAIFAARFAGLKIITNLDDFIPQGHPEAKVHKIHIVLPALLSFLPTPSQEKAERAGGALWLSRSLTRIALVSTSTKGAWSLVGGFLVMFLFGLWGTATMQIGGRAIKTGIIRLTNLITCLIFCMLLGCDRADNSTIPSQQQPSSNIPIQFIDNLYSLAAFGNDDFWTVGYYGTICHSNDGGRSWKRQASNTTSELFDVIFVTSQKGWIVGRHGTILHTGDGGATWQTQASPTASTLYKVHFVDEHNGWIAGYGLNGIILHTRDGGTSWIIQKEDEDRIYNSLYFADAAHGWVVGEYGTIYHTADGGITWIRQESGIGTISLYGVFFKDRQRGWAIGMDGVMIATEDGGSNWVKKDSGTAKHLYSIKIVGDKGFAVGTRGAFIASDNGGASWQDREKAIQSKYWLMDIAFSEDKQQGCMVGAHGTVIRTADEGETWEMVSGISILE